jgi:hypothetical protein
MRNILLSVVLAPSVLAIGVLGCGSSQPRSTAPAPPPASSAPPTAAQPAGGQMCPMMGMAGANVAAADTADGAALAFTTTGDPAELRAHVRRMADMHNHGGGHRGGMHHGGDMQGGMQGGTGGGGMHAGKEMHMVPSRASVEDLPNGARVLLVPNDPSQLSALRAQAREHAAMMAKGECPMMEPTPQAQPQPTGAHGQLPPTGAWGSSAAACDARACRNPRAAR